MNQISNAFGEALAEVNPRHAPAVEQAIRRAAHVSGGFAGLEVRYILDVRGWPTEVRIERGGELIAVVKRRHVPIEPPPEELIPMREVKTKSTNPADVAEPGDWVRVSARRIEQRLGGFIVLFVEVVDTEIDKPKRLLAGLKVGDSIVAQEPVEDILPKAQWVARRAAMDWIARSVVAIAPYHIFVCDHEYWVDGEKHSSVDGAAAGCLLGANDPSTTAQFVRAFKRALAARAEVGP